MCGRYVAPDVAALERYWNAKYAGEHVFTGAMRDRLQAFSKINYNTAKTQMVPVEIMGDHGPEIIPMRWGMDTHDWDPETRSSKEAISENKRHNARIEGFKKTPPFAQAWRKKQRGVQLVLGYYEWRVAVGGKKVPYYIRPTDQGEVFGLAALWDVAMDESGLLCCAHITMPPNEVLAKIHERMPAILLAQDQETWLAGTPKAAEACLNPYPNGLTIVRRVRPLVNNSRNNGPELLVPDERDDDTPEEEMKPGKATKRGGGRAERQQDPDPGYGKTGDLFGDS